MFRSIAQGFVFALALAFAVSCAGRDVAPAAPAPRAERIFLAEVVTLDEAGRIARAVAVRRGRILAVGSEEAVLATRGPETEVVDFRRAALLPGFIDAHSHLVAHATPLTGWANVSAPPVGRVRDLEDLIAELHELALRQSKRGGAPDAWLIGYGYERETLGLGRELRRDDLDRHFPERPVMLVHVSSHGAVLNSAALAAVGIDAATPTPPGGVIARRPRSQEPAGLLMENAFFAAVAKLPQPGVEESLVALGNAQLFYAANGYTTVNDGATDAAGLALLERAAEEGRLFLDVIALPRATLLPDILGRPGRGFGRYEKRLKLGGVKIVLDGSPQGRTAFFREPLLVPGPDGEPGWRGEPLMSQEVANTLFRGAAAAGVRTFTHANGDAAIDMFLAAHAAAGSPRDRPVVIHAQFARPDQLDAFLEIGAIPSFFTNHTFFWGDVHRENLGPARASLISPLASAAARGLRFTNHSDYAVTPLDPMFQMWSATERRARSGRVVGPGERVGVKTALRALTVDAAYQYGEEADKGTIEVGKLADFAVLEANPLREDDAELSRIRVLETVKEGVSVWRAEASSDLDPSVGSDW